jgi:hypothetical protein
MCFSVLLKSVNRMSNMVLWKHGDIVNGDDGSYFSVICIPVCLINEKDIYHLTDLERHNCIEVLYTVSGGLERGPRGEK